MRKLAVLAVLGVLAAMGLLLATEGGRSVGRAALLVAGLFAPQDKTPLSMITRPPVVSEVVISSGGYDVDARLFVPAGGGPHGALILVAGYPSNVDDAQLSAVAADLARMGIVALIPRLPSLSLGRLSRDDVAVLVDSYEWLARHADVAPSHIGYAGFCVGSSLSLLAAEDARINEEVRLVNVFGGYFNLANLLDAVGTRSYTHQGQSSQWVPSESTLMLVMQNTLARLPGEEREVIERHIIAGGSDDALRSTLSPTGLLALSLATSVDSAEMVRLLGQLPADDREHLLALSPSRDIDQLQARLFIMHDTSDPYIPAAESYRLAEAVGDAEQATFELFAHVRPRRTVDRFILIRDGVKLIGYLDDVLGEIMPSP